MITPTTFVCILPEYGQKRDRDGRFVEATTHAEAAKKAAERFCSERAKWPPVLVVHVRAAAPGVVFVARFEVAVESVPVFTAKQIKDAVKA